MTRSYLLASAFSVFLMGCSAIAASKPDSDNAAHCVAAFNNAAMWFSKGNPNPSGALQSKARALYELDKMRSDGSLNEAKEQSADILKKFGQDIGLMNDLLLQCAKKQDSDPDFITHHESLMRRARDF